MAAGKRDMCIRRAEKMQEGQHERLQYHQWAAHHEDVVLRVPDVEEAFLKCQSICVMQGEQTTLHHH